MASINNQILSTSTTTDGRTVTVRESEDKWGTVEKISPVNNPTKKVVQTLWLVASIVSSVAGMAMIFAGLATGSRELACIGGGIALGSAISTGIAITIYRDNFSTNSETHFHPCGKVRYFFDDEIVTHGSKCTDKKCQDAYQKRMTPPDVELKLVSNDS